MVVVTLFVVSLERDAACLKLKLDSECCLWQMAKFSWQSENGRIWSRSYFNLSIYNQRHGTFNVKTLRNAFLWINFNALKRKN